MIGPSRCFASIFDKLFDSWSAVLAEDWFSLHKALKLLVKHNSKRYVLTSFALILRACISNPIICCVPDNQSGSAVPSLR